MEWTERRVVETAHPVSTHPAPSTRSVQATRNQPHEVEAMVDWVLETSSRTTTNSHATMRFSPKENAEQKLSAKYVD